VETECHLKKIILGLAVSALAIMAVASSASAGGGTGITATPAASKTFSGTYSATFVRAASGIINETNRINTGGAQNDWTKADVWLQFRPLTGPSGTGTPTPNPSCDPAGLVTSFTWSNDANADPKIAGTSTSGYFIGTNPYNVCVYLVNPVVASGTIDSAAIDGTTATLPSGLNGNYRIDVSGTWTNGSNGDVDAAYTSDDNWATSIDGYDRNGFLLGQGFGDVQVNGGFVGWGASNSSHAYSYAASGLSGTVNLAVFDGDSNTNAKNAGWYGDNSGSLAYTITYVGQ
jgi:hypothetical protein